MVDHVAADGSQPPGRRGSCSFFHNGKFCIFSGYTEGAHLSVKASANLEVLDLSTGVWSTLPTWATSNDQLPLCISGSCCTVINNHLYVFGGWYRGYRNACVYELDINTCKWRKLEPINISEGPFSKDKAGMVAYGDRMVAVFGGYGYPCMEGDCRKQTGASYNWDPNSFMELCWTNELHLFHVEKCQWISPETTGVRPPPCAAFAFLKVDCCRVVLFGGRQLEERVNHLHILDMSNWHWSGAIMPCSPKELWPSKRSFHTACTLVDPNHTSYRTERRIMASHQQQRSFDWLPCSPPDLSPPEDEDLVCEDPKIFTLWGMDNDGDPVHDAWLFNVNSLTWKKVALPECAGRGRIWHTMASHHPTPCEAEIVAFGGTCQNLFKMDEALIRNVDKTTILHCGVQTLYQMCLRLVAKEYERFEAVFDQLPLHVQKLVRSELEKNAALDHFTNIRL